MSGPFEEFLENSPDYNRIAKEVIEATKDLCDKFSITVTNLTDPSTFSSQAFEGLLSDNLQNNPNQAGTYILETTVEDLEKGLQQRENYIDANSADQGAIEFSFPEEIYFEVREVRPEEYESLDMERQNGVKITVDDFSNELIKLMEELSERFKIPFMYDTEINTIFDKEKNTIKIFPTIRLDFGEALRRTH